MAPNWLTSFSSRFSMKQLLSKTGQNLIVLLYHGINDGIEIPFIDPLYPSRSATIFEKDIQFLTSTFESVGLSQIHQQKGKFDTPSFHITFDDGLRSVYEIALPILRKHKVHASIYLNNDFIDNKNLFYRYKVALIIGKLKEDVHLKNKLGKFNPPNTIYQWLRDMTYDETKVIDEIALELGLNFTDFLQFESPYLSTTQIEEMQELGFSFGAHTFDHQLVQDNKQSMQQEISKSIEDIQSRFGGDLRAFAFPFTDAGLDKTDLQKLSNVYEISFGTAGLKIDSTSQHYQRIPMEKDKMDAAAIIKNAYLYYYLCRMIGKHKIDRA